jgi:hypothetical protein
MIPRAAWATGMALAVALATSFARADEPAATGPAPSADAVAEARIRYGRATQLFEEGNERGALLEFRRSYELTHEYRVLYNIAQVCYRLHDYVCSVASFEQYLARGGDEIPEARKRDVLANVAELSPRIGGIAIATSEPGAEVIIDDVSRGRTPLGAPVPLSEGEHRITVQKEGRFPIQRVVGITGGETSEATFTLESASTRVIVRENPAAPETRWTTLSFVGLGAAGALAIGAGVTAGLAVSSSNRLSDTAYVDPPSDDVTSLRSRVRVLRTTADVLAAASVVTLGVTLLLTFTRDPRAASGRTPKVTVHAGLTGAAVRGTF